MAPYVKPRTWSTYITCAIYTHTCICIQMRVSEHRRFSCVCYSTNFVHIITCMHYIRTYVYAHRHECTYVYVYIVYVYIVFVVVCVVYDVWVYDIYIYTQQICSGVIILSIHKYIIYILLYYLYIIILSIL